MLSSGIEEVGSALTRAAEAYPTVDRQLLLADVTESLGHKIERRLFGAILGSQLRLGSLDVLPCAANTDRVFRVLVAASRLEELHHNLEEATVLLQRMHICRVSEIRDVILRDNRRGFWNSASHLAGRLVLLGRGEYVDRFTIVEAFGR